MNKIFVLLRIAAGAVFIISGFLKLVQPYQNFLAVINHFQIISGEPAVWIAVAMPWIEFISGVFLALGLWTRISAAALGSLSVLFMSVIGWALIRRLPIKECGCFGENFSLPIEKMIFVDFLLLAAFILLWKAYQHAKQFSLDSLWEE